MLDTEDIKKLTEYQLKAYKEVFLTKEDGKELEAKVDKLETTLKADTAVIKADVFVLKEDMAEIKETTHTLETKIDKVQNTVDSMAKMYRDDNQEITVLNSRMKNAEDFLDKAAPKLKMEFKH